MKFIRFGYALVVLVIAAAVALVAGSVISDVPAWSPALLAVLFVWPAQRHVRRQLTKITISGGKLRYESGFLSKTTRTIQLPKVQDVRVDQGLLQRIFNIGDLSIETAGETSRLSIIDIDRPQTVADHIIDASQAAAERGEGA